MLVKIKEIGKTDNQGVCLMVPDDRNKIMAVYRNSFKNPDRKKFKAPAKEFMQLWDAGDDGKQPNATMVMAAENARLDLLELSQGYKKGGVERARNQAAGINAAQWSFIGPGNIGGRIRAILVDPRNSNRLLVGAASGLLNGAAGIGGPPAIVFYFATTATAVSRASLIAFFLFTDVYALAWAGGTGLLATAAWPLIGVALPFSLLGIWLGQRGFQRLDDARLRRLIWALLAALGAVGVAGALWRLGVG